jgi:Rod binding domain-containing protein
MTDFSTNSVPVNLILPTPTAPLAPGGAVAETAKRAQIAQSAQNFESQFLSSMLGEMFEGVSTDGPFGGGQGEQMFRSFMTDAFGKQMAKAGGVGVAAAVQREMLKMQGLS